MADTERRVSGLGWVRDLPDPRDLLYSAPLANLRQLPSSVDLRPKCPAVYDQGRIGSCTANAIAGAIQFGRMKAKDKPDFVPSRLFIYYNERAMEGHVAYDSGAQIRDGIKSVARQGVCTEKTWAYNDTPAEYEGGPFPPGSKPGKKPTKRCYTEAANYQVTSYQRLSQLLAQLKGCLASGYPFVFGITVFPSFWSAPGQQATNTPMPGPGEAPVGGHAIMAAGYDDANQCFTVRNSWGPDQADKGYFYLPYAYATEPQLASDFWTIRTVEN
jgi:C1A family cysteine protease